jgi:type II secretory pathway component PulF
MILPVYMITWTASSTEEVLDSAGGLITDLSPLLIAVIGVGLGLIVISVLVGVIRGKE